MKMRKLGLGILLFSFVLSLTACSGKDKKQTESSTTKGGQTTISYAIWDSGQEPGIRKIADKFEEKNPKIKVDIQVVSWDTYWTMLEAGATGGSLPDTFWMHSNEIYRYGANQMLLNLDDYIKSSKIVSLSHFPKDLTSIYAIKGHQYAIPKDFDTIGLWYNKKMFDEAGIKYPDETWKWVEYLSSKEGQVMQAKLGVAISAYKGTSDTWVDSNKHFKIKHFIDMLDYAQIRPYSNATTKWEDKAYETLKPAYLGKESVEKAAQKTAKMMNEELESEK